MLNHLVQMGPGARPPCYASGYCQLVCLGGGRGIMEAENFQVPDHNTNLACPALTGANR